MTSQCTCPLCGHSFDPAAHLACQTCPLHSGCRLVCCPACGHTTVDQGQSRLVRWITTFLERASGPKQSTLVSDPLIECTLAEAPIDRRVRVADVSALPATQRGQLQGYGVLPGCSLQVIQHAPVTVVKIEHIELAIEPEVARAMRVTG